MTGTFHIVLAMKPLDGNFAKNAIKHGVAGLNIDGCRVAGPKGDGVWGTSNKTINTERKFNASPEMTDYRSEQHPQGRFPANVILERGHVVGSLDEQSGDRAGFSGGGIRMKKSAIMPSIVVGKKDAQPNYYGDSGGASRFFKRVKA